VFVEVKKFETDWNDLADRVLRIRITRWNPSDALDSGEAFFNLVSIVRATLKSPAACGCVVEFTNQDDLPLTTFEQFCKTLATELGQILEETRNTNAVPMPSKESVYINLDPLKNRDSLLHFGKPERSWPLHTDRALYEETGDFVLVGKMIENGLEGGLIRLLHIEDFDDLDKFLQNKYAFSNLEWKGDENLAPIDKFKAAVKSKGVVAPVFNRVDASITIRFTDSRFRRPQCKEQLEMLRDLSRSLEQKSDKLDGFAMKIKTAYIINNRRVLHGRSGFKVLSSDYYRRLVRFCGLLGS
jgi:hypothetical protein